MKTLDYFRDRYSLERTLSPDGEKHFEVSITKYAKYLGRDPTLADFESQQFNGFVKATEAWLKKTGKPYADKTRRGWRDDLVSIWKFAYERGDCEFFPKNIRQVKLAEPNPDPFSKAEMRRLIKGAKSLSYVSAAGVPSWIFLPAYLQFVAETALRRSDALRVNVKSLHFHPGQGGIVRMIQSKNRKAHASRFSESCAKKIRKLIAVRKLVCPETAETPFLPPFRCKKTLDDWIAAAGEIAGVRTERRKSQAARAYAGDDAFRQGGESAAKAKLGHKSPQMWEHYVSHSTRSQLVDTSVFD